MVKDCRSSIYEMDSSVMAGWAGTLGDHASPYTLRIRWSPRAICSLLSLRIRRSTDLPYAVRIILISSLAKKKEIQHFSWRILRRSPAACLNATITAPSTFLPTIFPPSHATRRAAPSYLNATGDSHSLLNSHPPLPPQSGKILIAPLNHDSSISSFFFF